MKKFFLSFILLAMATIMVQAQDATHQYAPLVEPVGNYYFCGNQAMNKKQYGEFLSTRCEPAYKKFQSGYKCYQAGWALLGAGLAVDLAGSIVWALAPESTPDGKASTFTIAGGTLVIAGSCAILASLPTIYIGYIRMDESADIYNVSQRTASSTPAYWTVQGSENGIGIALNF